MKTLVLTLIALLLASSMSIAQGSLSVPFTAAQQQGVAWANDRDNVQRVADGRPTLTLSEYGIAQCQSVFDSYKDQRERERENLNSVRDKYLGLSDADKASLESFIDGLVNP